MAHYRDHIAHLHLLCQAHNSFMQDKIGSGFDIQAAVYGSQVFKRSE